MLVYIVISGDMLVGKPGYKGLLCSYLGDHAHLQWTCNRTIVTGLVTIVVLAPLVSFRYILTRLYDFQTLLQKCFFSQLITILAYRYAGIIIKLVDKLTWAQTANFHIEL